MKKNVFILVSSDDKFIMYVEKEKSFYISGFMTEQAAHKSIEDLIDDSTKSFGVFTNSERTQKMVLNLLYGRN